MKIIRIFGRGVKDACKSVFRNFSLSLASVSSTAITLIIVSIAILFTYNVNVRLYKLSKSMVEL